MAPFGATAVIKAEPAVTPLTFPFVTVATPSLADFHINLLFSMTRFFASRARRSVDVPCTRTDVGAMSVFTPALRSPRIAIPATRAAPTTRGSEASAAAPVPFLWGDRSSKGSERKGGLGVRIREQVVERVPDLPRHHPGDRSCFRPLRSLVPDSERAADCVALHLGLEVQVANGRRRRRRRDHRNTTNGDHLGAGRPCLGRAATPAGQLELSGSRSPATCCNGGLAVLAFEVRALLTFGGLPIALPIALRLAEWIADLGLLEPRLSHVRSPYSWRKDPVV